MDIDQDFSKYWGRAGELGIGGATADPAFFVSRAQFEAEREQIFRRDWLMVARDAEVPEPGDFIRRTIYPLATEAIIVRGKDNAVRAFYNVCPHRGTAMVRECAGNAKLFICPYHAWSFSTDGKLRGIPGAADFPQVDRETLGLTPIHAEVWNGFVFLNFAEQPRQSLPEFLGDFATSFGDLPFADHTHVIEISQEINANWKLLIDASLESYHVGALHKETLGAQITSPDNPYNNPYDPIFAGPHISSTTQANANWRPDQPVVQFIYSAAAYRAQPGKPEPAKQAEGQKTFADYPIVNRVGLPAFSVENTFIFPCSILQILTNRYIWFQYWPVAENKTRFILRLYGPAAPQSYGQELAEAHMIAYSRDIVTEDAMVVQFQQAGLESGGIKQVVFGEHEYMPRFFHETVRKITQG